MTVYSAEPARIADTGLTNPLTLDSAYAHVLHGALADSVGGTVGLEIETHLVDLMAAPERVDWNRIVALPETIKLAAGRSAITLEPGGQFELSGPALPDIATAIATMRAEAQRVRLALAEQGLGLAYAGADPLRPARRVNPRSRYRAMEVHFAAVGLARPGAYMMNSTAALQVNLQAGPTSGWADRIAQAHRLGPTLIALSACSPWLDGRDAGWKSARQRVWGELNARANGPNPRAADPAAEWARYAMNAPVMFVGTADDATAVAANVTFAQWVSGAVKLGNRSPTVADLDLHLTTLFPKVRLRGYLELRYLDMSPPRWWPAVAAVATILMDDPVAADSAAEATEPAAELWTEAAREGLGNRELARSARRCLEIAASRAPLELSTPLADLAELVESGRCPGDLLAGRIAEIGHHAAFEELARA